MLVFCLLIILILIILFIVIFAFTNTNTNTSNFKNKRKERYGPPPGKRPAINMYAMGDRGWPSAPFEFSGVTASSLINYVEPWPEYPYQQAW